MENEIVQIALASDQNYLRGLVVTASSIAKYANKACKLHFHILHTDLTYDDCQLLSKRILSFHTKSEIDYHDISTIDMSHYPNYASSHMAYARLFLPYILPNLSYVIYSDVDVLWADDICELWHCHNDVRLISSVRELSQGTIKMEKEWFESQGLPFDEHHYFCSGISLFNLDEIRRQNAFAPVLKFGRTYKGFNCADQSMLNGALGNKVTPLADKWQTLPRNGIKTKRGEPIVLHYAGEAPWKISHITKMLTDTQLLWFDMCAEVFRETRWLSLRHFYTTGEIILYRFIFLTIFRIPPIHTLFRVWLRYSGRGLFEESYP